MTSFSLNSEFTPLISKRDTDELIEIAHSTTEEWQYEAIKQAKKELDKRGITLEEQKRTIQLWKEEAEEYFKYDIKRLNYNKTESYQAWEMIVLFLFGPFLFLRPYLFNSHTLFTLRGENYFLKFKQRIIIFF